ncbi:MAG: hypothetical protein Tsb0020_15120 [Haliangiales bacterium]
MQRSQPPPDSPRPAPTRAHAGHLSTLVRAIASPAAVRLLPRRSWTWLGIYVAASAALLGAIALLFDLYQAPLRQLIYDYLFPGDWHSTLDLVLERFFLAQQRVVIINAIIAASLVAVTVLLFPLKEWASASFERGAGLTDQPPREHPLIQQAWQEIKLFLLFIAIQGAIFAIGYPPVPILKSVAVGLGYLLIFFTFATDFISPLLQRHRGYYSQILRILARHPLASLSFGALFALPTIAVGRLWVSHPDWSLGVAVALVFGVNLLCMAWAVVAGTWLAAKFLPILPATPRSGVRARAGAWLALLLLLGANGYLYGSILQSAHHKSQLLKCHYEVDFSSFDIEKPSLGEIFNDQVALAVSFDVVIENPTAFDVDVEDSELIVSHREKSVARSLLTALAVPAGQTRTQTIELTLAIDPQTLSWDRALLDLKTWEITLYLDIAPYLRMPVYLLHPRAR